MTVLDFKIGDLVRVRAARRRDVVFTVLEVSESHVRARREGERGGEAIYAPEAFEHIKPTIPQSQAIGAQPIATSTASADPIAPPTMLEPAPETSMADMPQTQRQAQRWLQLTPFGATVDFRDHASVRPYPDETIDSIVKRFKKAVQKSGILAEARKHEHFEKPSIRRKKKAASARARRAKSLYSVRRFPA